MASFIPKAGNLEVVRPRVYWFPQRNVKCQQLRHFPEGRARGQRNAFLLFFTMCAKAEKLELFGTHPFFSAQEAGGKPCLAARWNHPESFDDAEAGCGLGIWIFKSAQEILRCRQG